MTEWANGLRSRIAESSHARESTAGLVRRRRSPLTPQLSYGRHRGRARHSTRRASVVAAIYWINRPPREHASATIGLFQDARILLTRRPMSLTHHGGQICLPGGRIEPGESSLEAALREFHEEVGVPAMVRQSLGTLATQYVYASDNIVDPHVVWIDAPDRPFVPDPVEVDEVIEVPVRELIRHCESGSFESRTERRAVHNEPSPQRPLEFSKPGFYVDRRHIWGATSMILEELARHLLQLTRDSDSAAN